MSDVITHEALQGRAIRVWSEHVATVLTAAFNGDAAAAASMAESAEEPGRLLAVCDDAPLFCDLARCEGLSVGWSVADGHTGAALVLRRAAEDYGNDLAVTLAPHELLALLADLTLMAQEQARYAVFQTPELTQLAEAVEAGLAGIRLTPGRVAVPPTQAAADEGFRQGLLAAAEAAERLAALYPAGIPADVLAGALQVGADQV